MIRSGKFVASALCLASAGMVRAAAGDPMPVAAHTPLKHSAGRAGIIDHLELTGTDVRSVYRLLSEYSDVDIIVDPTVTGQVSASIHEKNWQEVVQIVAKMLNLTVTNEMGYLYVQKTEDYDKKLLEKSTSSQSQAGVARLQRKIIRVNNATAEDMDKAVKDLLSPRGKTTVVSRTNSIIVTDGEEQIAAIEKVIKQLDQETNQVMIEAKLIQVSSGSTQELGVNWTAKGSMPSASGKSGDGAVTVQNNTPISVSAGAAGSQAITFGLLNGNLNAVLQHLLSTNKGEVVASPQITTLDNKQARIFMGDKVPVNTRDVSGNTLTTYVDAGTELVVTPLITAQDRILLSLKPSRNSYSVVSGAGTVISTQSAETNVFVSDGETVVIGGLVSKEEKKTESGIPLLKDIPFLGYLFKSTSNTLSKTDLIIFVTPHIVRKDASMHALTGNHDLAAPVVAKEAAVDKTSVSSSALQPAATTTSAPAPAAPQPQPHEAVPVPQAVAPAAPAESAPAVAPAAAPAVTEAPAPAAAPAPTPEPSNAEASVPPPSMDTVSAPH